MEYTKKNYKKAPLSSIHFRIYFALALGQIACGFALGISGTALSQATDYINITDFWVGLIGAGSLIGLAGSALMGLARHSRFSFRRLHMRRRCLNPLWDRKSG